MAAWTKFYKKGLTAPYGTALAYGIMACKAELIYNGYNKNVNPTLNVFGDAASNRTKEFQSDRNLISDGIIGPITSKELFRKRISEVEKEFNIPDSLICKQISLESNFDPAATGNVDPRDRGFAQINSFWHPDVDDSEAFDPAFSIRWTASFFSNNFKNLNDIDATIAAHNVGTFYAKKWLLAGKPAAGLLTLNGKDYAEMCTKYVNLIKSKTC